MIDYLQLVLFTPVHQAYYASLAALLVVAYWQPAIAVKVRMAVLRSSVRGFFSSPQESPKFALLRIALGIILIWRGWDEWRLLTLHDFSMPAIYLYSITNLLTGVAVLFGLFTQWTFLFLILVQWQYGDVHRGTGTLGNDVGAMLVVLLGLTQSGRHLSIDAWLIRRFTKLRAWLLYSPQPSSAETITIAKWLALFSYWLVCVYSLSMHLNEASWMNGTAGPLLLSSNFMNKYYGLFTHFFVDHDWAVHVARISLWMMLPWYLLLMPAVLLGGAPRRYAILWGLLFFCLSKFLLQLGWLAEIEFLFWAGLFWSRTGIGQLGRFAIAFDDTCNLCDRTVRFVRIVDVFERTQLKPASKNKPWLAEYGITYERAMEDLHGIDTATGRYVAGYDFYITLARQLVLLWPLYPILLLGKWLAIGPRIYRWIAERRRALFGYCEVPTAKRSAVVYEMAEDRHQQRIIGAVAMHIILLGLFYLIAIPAPYVGRTGWHNTLADAAHINGTGPINVFNATYLRMAENWFTLSFIGNDGEVLMPLLTPEGARLSYHRSDRVYFGNTLYFRRAVIDQPGCQYEPMKPNIDYLASIYLDQQEMPAGTYRVRYTQYNQPLADVELLKKNRYVANPITTRCDKIITLKRV